MIIETKLDNNLVERKSDQNVFIRNTVTGYEYEAAVDLTNEERQRRGFEPYFYEETNKPIETEETLDNEAFIAEYEKAIAVEEETEETEGIE